MLKINITITTSKAPAKMKKVAGLDVQIYSTTPGVVLSKNLSCLCLSVLYIYIYICIYIYI